MTADKGAPLGNTYAKKGDTGKTISLYLTPGILPAIHKIRSERRESDTSEAACMREAKDYALEGIQQHISPAPEIDQLRFMVSNWQALSNHAEVFAPELLQNPQWIAMKVDLERRNDELRVTAFINQVAERYREQIEAEDD